MCAKAVRVHGGRAPPGFHDFSTPLNPLGTPEFVEELISEAVKLKVYRSYPDYEYRELREAIASFYGFSPESVIPLNGAAEALYLAVLTFRPRIAVAIEPTFGDHSALFRATNIPEVSVILRELEDSFALPVDALSVLEKLPEESLLILSNPNNPTGLLLRRSDVLKLAERFRGVVIVDEAFIELSDNPSESVLRDAEASGNLVVVRSLTKTLAVPGLRIGFVVAPRKLAELLEAVRQPWNMNAIAAYVASRLLKEYSSELSKFLDRSRSVVISERGYLSEAMRALGIRVYSSAAPYILARLPKTRLYELSGCLTEHRVVLRDASSFKSLTPYHFRASVKLREENEILIEALRRCLQEAG